MQITSQNIERLNAAEAADRLTELAALLANAVNSGASVGFHPPLAEAEALAYWRGVLPEISDGSRVLIAATEEGTVAGVVQLQLCGKANGRHRAEVQKLMVHTDRRRRGYGRKLMEAAEGAAMDAGRSLLMLDTRTGDAAEQLYLELGYTRFGVVPDYTIAADGSKHDTSFMFKALSI